MRLTADQRHLIPRIVHELAGERAEVRLFGSRLDDHAKGGDIDLLLSLPAPVEHPAQLAAQISARLSRALGGQKVDVLLSTPNLQRFPIHDIAQQQGAVL